MPKFFLPIFLLLCVTALGQRTSLAANKAVILKDFVTKCIYVLDSTHTSIAAYDSKGKNIWTSRAHNCSYNLDTSGIIIFSMAFGYSPARYCKECAGEKVIMINYCNCAAFIRLKTGNLYELGCD